MGKREEDLGWSIRKIARKLAEENGLNRKEELKILNRLREKEGMGEYINLPGCPDCDISYTPELNFDHSSTEEKSGSNVGKIVATGAAIGLGLLGISKLFSND